jgi:hypothetical protein
MTLVEIRNQPGMYGFPAQHFLRLHAGSRHIVAEETADPAKMAGDLVAGSAYHGQVKMPADRPCYVAGRYTFFADIGRNTFLTGEIDEHRNEPFVILAMPLHMVASYLGVSRETLSRIRHARLKQ